MNNNDERDYAEEAANRALMHEEEPDETRTIGADLARYEHRILIAETGEDAAQGGESMHWRSLMTPDREPWDGVRVEYLLIDCTGWGDYSGSTYSRSNFRVLGRDYREHLIEAYDSMGTKQWAVRIGAEVPEGLYDSIARLAEYPILDDDDEYEVVAELEQECWESFGRNEFRDAIYDLAQDPESWPELEDADYLKTLFQESRERCDYEYGNFESESAVSGYWTDPKQLAGVAWQHIRNTRDGVYPLEGQLVLI